MGLSSSKSKTQSTTTSTPYTPATPAINAGIDAAQSVFQQNQPILAQNAALAQQAYQQIAPGAFSPSPYVTQAQKAAQGIAGGQYMGGNPAHQAYQDMLSGGGAGNGTLDQFAGGANVYDPTTQDYYKSILDPNYVSANPFVDKLVATTGADVTKAANQRFAASGMGSGISSAFGDLLTKNLANSENTIRYQNFNDASNRQLSAAGQADSQYNNGRALQLGAAQNQASNQLAAASGADASHNASVQQMLAAAGLAPELAQAQYAGVSPALSLLGASSTIPYAGLQAYSGALGSLAGQYGTTNSTGTSTSSGSIIDNIAKLAQAGASVATAAKSDIRAKRDISRIGELSDGLGVYRYRYLWDDEPRIGVMAQEVAALRPWALGPIEDGYMTVVYEAL